MKKTQKTDKFTYTDDDLSGIKFLSKDEIIEIEKESGTELINKKNINIT